MKGALATPPPMAKAMGGKRGRGPGGKGAPADPRQREWPDSIDRAGARHTVVCQRSRPAPVWWVTHKAHRTGGPPPPPKRNFNVS